MCVPPPFGPLPKHRAAALVQLIDQLMQIKGENQSFGIDMGVVARLNGLSDRLLQVFSNPNLHPP